MEKSISNPFNDDRKFVIEFRDKMSNGIDFTDWHPVGQPGNIIKTVTSINFLREILLSNGHEIIQNDPTDFTARGYKFNRSYRLIPTA